MWLAFACYYVYMSVAMAQSLITFHEELWLHVATYCYFLMWCMRNAHKGMLSIILLLLVLYAGMKKTCRQSTRRKTDCIDKKEQFKIFQYVKFVLRSTNNFFMRYLLIILFFFFPQYDNICKQKGLEKNIFSQVSLMRSITKKSKIFTFFNEYFKCYSYLFKSRDKHYLTWSMWMLPLIWMHEVNHMLYWIRSWIYIDFTGFPGKERTCSKNRVVQLYTCVWVLCGNVYKFEWNI